MTTKVVRFTSAGPGEHAYGLGGCFPAIDASAVEVFSSASARDGVGACDQENLAAARGFNPRRECTRALGSILAALLADCDVSYLCVKSDATRSDALARTTRSR
jgi:hypothetical protein